MARTRQPDSPALAEFEAQGYITARGMFSPDEIDGLLEQIRAAGTREDQPDLLDDGELRFISNAFRRNRAVRDFICQPRLVEFLTPVIGPDFWVRWDQAVEKGPGAGEFPWHQDNGYSQLIDQHYQLWIALTKGTRENGGLWLQPSADRVLLPHERRGNHMAYRGEPADPVFVEAEVGDVVLFSSFTLHATTPNRSDASRWAYVVEYMSLDHIDPTGDAPYFVAARGGEPVGRFVKLYRGRLNPANYAKYFVSGASSRLRSLARAGFQKVAPIRP